MGIFIYELGALWERQEAINNDTVCMYVCVCNITNVLNLCMIDLLLSTSNSLNSNKFALLLSEHQLQWHLFIKNTKFCAVSGPSHILFFLKCLLLRLSSTLSPQLISTHQVSVLMFLLPWHFLWLLSLLIAIIRIEFLSYLLNFFISPLLDNIASRAEAVLLRLFL